MDAMRSRPFGGGMLAKCVFGRLAVTRYARIAPPPNVRRRRYFAVVRPWAAVRGNILASCIPKAPLDGKSAPPWQHIAAMHPKRAGFGKICAPCIRKAPQTAVRECIARRSCQGGPLFAARTPRIMHGARILPRFSARKVLRAEGWRRWVVASALCIEADGPAPRPAGSAPTPSRAQRAAHARGRRPRIP